MIKKNTKNYDDELTPSHYFDITDPVVEKNTRNMEDALWSKTRKNKKPSHRFFRAEDEAKTPEIFPITSNKSEDSLNSPKLFGMTKSFVQKSPATENIDLNTEMDTSCIKSSK